MHGQLIQSRCSVADTEDTEVFTRHSDIRVLSQVIVSLPNTPHGIASDDLFKLARGCVPNFQETARKEQNEWMEVRGTLGDPFPLNSDAATNQSPMLVDKDPEL